MYISKLYLSTFRNYDRADISFSPEINVIYGNNGSGKTNVLEAISIISRGKSQRSNKDSEIVMVGNEGFMVKGFLDNTYQSTIQYIYQEGIGKRILYNGQGIKSAKEIFSQLPTVSFLPENLDLVKGGPEQRRIFLDDILTVTSIQYRDHLNRYSKVLYQRNRLLKDIRKKGLSRQTLDSWDQQLITYGRSIVNYRLKLILDIKPLVQENYAKLSNNKETIYLEYINTLDEKLLFDKREEDILRGHTSIGPHRDDLDVMINNQAAKSFASQGQQRSIVLSLKLAEVDYLQKIFDRWPILLLDDVMSELDEQRRLSLVELAKTAGQVFLTTTEREHVPKELGKATYFYVDNGSIQRRD